MNLALILGTQGERVKPRLQTVKDNLTIDCYNTVPLFIDTSLKRDLHYDRAIVISNQLNDSTIEDLHTYWSEYSPDTDIIMMGKEGKDEGIAKAFLGKFVTTHTSAMLVQKTTVQAFSEAVIMTPDDITAKYGIHDYLDLEVDSGVQFDDGGTTAEPEKPAPVQEPKKVTQTEQKKTIFGALFKGNKKSKDLKGKIDNGGTAGVTKVTAESAKAVASSVKPPVVTPEPTPTVEYEADNSVEEVESFAVEYEANEEPVEVESPAAEYEADSSVEEVVVSDSNSFVENPTVVEEPSQEYERYETATDEVEEIDTMVDIDMSDSSEEVENIEVSPISVSPSAPVEEQVNIDLGEVAIAVEAPKPAPKFNYTPEEVQDVFLPETDVSTAESGYRQATEKPQVIVKEKVREVHVGGTSSVLDSVLSGRAHKVLLVTGDRGSGITMTAYSIAKKFSEKIHVLYFDCDVERHGILSYIDYTLFRNYQDNQRNALNLCRSSRALKECLCKFDNNFDFLTTDYEFDVSDEALELAQTIVAENVSEYGLTVIDCPIDKLDMLIDLIPMASIAVCVECSKRGIMNTLCALESLKLPNKYKRMMCSGGTILFTKVKKQVSPKDVIQYANNIYEADECDWLDMTHMEFNGKMTKALLTEVLER